MAISNLTRDRYDQWARGLLFETAAFVVGLLVLGGFALLITVLVR